MRCNRVANINATNIWNSLPIDIVTAPTLNSFKNRLDEHWLQLRLLRIGNLNYLELGVEAIYMFLVKLFEFLFNFF